MYVIGSSSAAPRVLVATAGFYSGMADWLPHSRSGTYSQTQAQGFIYQYAQGTENSGFATIDNAWFIRNNSVSPDTDHTHAIGPVFIHNDDAGMAPGFSPHLLFERVQFEVGYVNSPDIGLVMKPRAWRWRYVDDEPEDSEDQWTAPGGYEI